jgi:hypothetical protein
MLEHAERMLLGMLEKLGKRGSPGLIEKFNTASILGKWRALTRGV